jgi:nucleotide-binding universal stress UspA family protein
MGYNDILLHLDSYPDSTPPEAVDQAVRICAALGGQITATAFHVRIPVTSNFIAERLLGLSQMARDQEARSLDNVWSLLARFATEAEKARLKHHNLPAQVDYYDRPDHLSNLARTYDLCVIPYFGEVALQTSHAEATVFGSGRPVVIFRGDTGDKAPLAFKRILIAWDGGRAASRAVADAMPLLKAAEEVRILTIVDDKPATVGAQTDALRRHLAAHGIEAQAEEHTADGRGAGDVLEQVATERGFDLLVMGAFGHSRVREFLLGGATQHILTAPPIPVLLAH